MLVMPDHKRVSIVHHLHYPQHYMLWNQRKKNRASLKNFHADFALKTNDKLVVWGIGRLVVWWFGRLGVNQLVNSFTRLLVNYLFSRLGPSERSEHKKSQRCCVRNHPDPLMGRGYLSVRAPSRCGWATALERAGDGGWVEAPSSI